MTPDRAHGDALAIGSRVHVYAETLTGHATIDATWHTLGGALMAYQVSLDAGAQTWVEPLAVFALDGLEDRPAACWSSSGSRA